MFVRLLTYFICLTGFQFINAQAGIYSENDITLQDLYIKAQLEKHKNNTEEQINLLKEVVRRDRVADAAYYELGRAYLLIEDLEQAEKNTSKAIQINGDIIWYKILLLDIYEASEQYEKAIQLCRDLQSSDAKNTEYIERLAFNQLKSGNDLDAVRSLSDLQQQQGVTEKISKRIFDIHHNAGRKTEAIATLKALSEAFPKNVRLLNNLAGYLYDHNDKEKALDYYRKVIELDPDNVKARFALSRETAVDDPASSLNGIASLIEADSPDLDAIIQELMPYIANMSREGTQTEKLLEISKVLVDRFPNDAKSNSIRADVLFYSGNISEAEKVYEKTIDLDDRQYTVWDQWLQNLWELKAFNKMQSIAMDAIDLFPNQPNAYIMYAMAAFMNNDQEEAKEYIEEASLVAGKNARYQTAIKIIQKWILKDQLSPEDIIAEISDIEDARIYSPMLYELLGDLYLNAGRPEKTREYWNKAVSFGADRQRIDLKMGSLN